MSFDEETTPAQTPTTMLKHATQRARTLNILPEKKLITRVNGTKKRIPCLSFPTTEKKQGILFFLLTLNSI
ncbi:MAG: hypothetical protein J6B92_09775 [Paraprevotella sp.]|nr:hypothetical protein [Paraprevotella sp.]